MGVPRRRPAGVARHHHGRVPAQQRPGDRLWGLGRWSGGARPIVGGVLEHPQWFNWLIGNDWGWSSSSAFIAIAWSASSWLPGREPPPTLRPARPALGRLLALVYGIQKGDWGRGDLWIRLGLAVLAGSCGFESRTSHRRSTWRCSRSVVLGVVAGVSLSFGALQHDPVPRLLPVVRGWSRCRVVCDLPFASASSSRPRSARCRPVRGPTGDHHRDLRHTVAMSDRPRPGTPRCGTCADRVPVPGSASAMWRRPRPDDGPPPARSGSGAACGTVRQVGAALGVAILVGRRSIYRGRIGDTLAGSPLPANLPNRERLDRNFTYEVAGGPPARHRPGRAPGRRRPTRRSCRRSTRRRSSPPACSSHAVIPVRRWYRRPRRSTGRHSIPGPTAHNQLGALDERPGRPAARRAAWPRDPTEAEQSTPARAGSRRRPAPRTGRRSRPGRSASTTSRAQAGHGNVDTYSRPVRASRSGPPATMAAWRGWRRFTVDTGRTRCADRVRGVLGRAVLVVRDRQDCVPGATAPTWRHQSSTDSRRRAVAPWTARRRDHPRPLAAGRPGISPRLAQERALPE
jgi:hypothetical protein